MDTYEKIFNAGDLYEASDSRLAKTILKSAKELAKEKHADQLYGEVPYKVHLWMVADTVHRFFEDLSDYQTALLTAAALLHDVIEDTVAIFDDVYDVDREVAWIVHAVSDGDGKNRKERKREVYKKINAYESEFFDFNPALAVKLADRIANVESSRGSSLFKMYKEEHHDFKQALYKEREDARIKEMWKKLDSLFG